MRGRAGRMAPAATAPYHAPRRKEQAQRTYRAILDAAGELLSGAAMETHDHERGRRGRRGGRDTVYAAVGPKRVLFRAAGA